MYTVIGSLFLYSLTWIHTTIATYRFVADSKEDFKFEKVPMVSLIWLTLSIFVNVLLLNYGIEKNSPITLITMLNLICNFLLVVNDFKYHYTISDVIKLFVKDGK